ncbi:D-alanine--D-alanine ligase [bacterium]|nr:D-alanine--D-alanine ligase [bacterium]MBU1921079.1 D-alanine--D-alanine ligase [bacterium]
MKLLVLCGGESVERNVSLASGNSVADWLLEAGHAVVKYDPERPGILYDGSEHLGGPEIGLTAPAENLSHGFDTSRIKGLIEAIETVQPDLVYPILHGGYGEDGTVQSVLEWIGIPYVGSGPLACQIAMNKEITRRILRDLKIPIAEGFPVPKEHAVDAVWVARRVSENFGYPAVFKPVKGGSTVGLTIIRSAEEIKAALELIASIEDLPLIERYFSGREMTATVVDGKCYPLIEIRSKQGFYDYANKYSPGRVEYVCPVELPQAFQQEIQTAAVDAYNALGCEGCARIDFLVSSSDFICLEVNTIPGMTAEFGLVPKAAKAYGKTPVKLVQKLVDGAMRRAHLSATHQE